MEFIKKHFCVDCLENVVGNPGLAVLQQYAKEVDLNEEDFGILLEAATLGFINGSGGIDPGSG